MLDFEITTNTKTGEKQLQTSLSGKMLLTIPQLNKDTAFTEEERRTFNLMGKLPIQVETLKEQVERCYKQYQHYKTPFQQNIYLNNLHGRNQTLFYKLVSDYLPEILPLIYTPVVGTTVKKFSDEFRQPKGLYIPYPNRDEIRQILKNRSNPDIKLIVVTDGEGILGIGDQGINGIAISISKLMLYTLCAGVNPLDTLPIQLDVGTNNEQLLNDPLYLGWRNKRISGKAYDDFIEQFVDAVQKEFPNVFLHWEDLGRANASRVLENYQNRLCTFNDDIQGTGVVSLAAILAAIQVTQTKLHEQRIVIFGAGTAGTGIANEIFRAMQRNNISSDEAKKCFWLINRKGLITDDMSDLMPEQRFYARPVSEVTKWNREETNIITLLEVIKQVKPTILIGCSSTPNTFHQEIIEKMAAHTERPIVLSLSNPTELSEAIPSDIIKWTNGKALIATGSPFEDVVFKGQTFPIAQCNNALVFPGIGLGAIAVKAKTLSSNMLWAACQALSNEAPILKNPQASLLPSIDGIQKNAFTIACAVASCAIKEGIAQLDIPENEVADFIRKDLWTPHYLPYYRRP